MASIFDSTWEAVANQMDDAVDDMLGDRISYSVDAGVTFVTWPGFVIDVVVGEEQVEGLDDDFAVRKRVKVRKTLLEAPLKSHRIRHPKLGTGTFRPTNSVPQTQGRYWLFDVQKVS